MTFAKLWLNSKNDEFPQEAREHLEHCAECRRKVERYGELLTALKSDTQLPDSAAKTECAVMSRIENLRPEAQHSSHRKLWIASAAASVAVLIVAGLFFHQHSIEKSENKAIVEMISEIHDEQRQPREQTSAYSDLAMLESYLTDVNNQ